MDSLKTLRKAAPAKAALTDREKETLMKAQQELLRIALRKEKQHSDAEELFGVREEKD